MNSPKTPKKTPSPNNDLVAQLQQLGLRPHRRLARRPAGPRLDSAAGVPANCWKKSPAPKPKTAARRSLERRLAQARLGRFKPLADFDWHWPKKIDRPLIERALTLDFLARGRNSDPVRHERAWARP